MCFYLATSAGRVVVYQSWPGCFPPKIISMHASDDTALPQATCYESEKNGQTQEYCGDLMRSHC